MLDVSVQAQILNLQGDLPPPVNPPAGCHFHPRCPQAMPECGVHYPVRTQLTATHAVNCYLYKQGN